MKAFVDMVRELFRGSGHRNKYALQRPAVIKPREVTIDWDAVVERSRLRDDPTSFAREYFDAKPGAAVPMSTFPHWDLMPVGVVQGVDLARPGGDWGVIARRDGNGVVDFKIVDEASEIPRSMWEDKYWDRASDDHSFSHAHSDPNSGTYPKKVSRGTSIDPWPVFLAKARLRHWRPMGVKPPKQP